MEKKANYLDLVIAGAAGLGALLIGRLLAEAGMSKYKHVNFFPLYSMLMRAGSSECTVVLSDEEIGAPSVFNPSGAILLGQLALAEFGGRVKSGGLVILDSSLTPVKLDRNDLNVYAFPASEVAVKLGSNRVANLVLLGAYIEITKVVSLELIEDALDKKLSNKAEMLALNKRALREGAKIMAEEGR